jgi:HEAT repeat protein
MRLRPCPFCRKDIPAGITLCPYCKRGAAETPPAPSSSEPILDTGTKSDLNELMSDDGFARKSAADRLLRNGAALVPVLTRMMRENEPRKLGEVAQLLGRLRDPRAVAPLAEALRSADEDLHASAVWALAQLKTPEAINELLREAERNNPTVQSYIAHALSATEDARAVPALIKLARHRNLEVSLQAAWGLGEAGDTRAIGVLRQLWRREKGILKLVSDDALRRLGGAIRWAVPRWALILGVIGVVAAALLLYYW